MKSLLLSLPHLKRLSLALCQILELESNDIKIASRRGDFHYWPWLTSHYCVSGSKVKSLLLSLPHLKRLSLALCQILELESNDIKIVEERTTITGHG